jgi:hypothetical protein
MLSHARTRVHARACAAALRLAAESGHMQPVRALRRPSARRRGHRARRDNCDRHRAGRLMWRMCAKARRVEQTIEDVARVVQMPLPGYNSITVTQATYREVTRLAKELRVSRAEILRRALHAIENSGEWATVRIDDGVQVCRVDSLTWSRGTYRVMHPGGRASADKACAERLQYLRSALR